jgi:predicted transcriptional regulator YheO
MKKMVMVAFVMLLAVAPSERTDAQMIEIIKEGIKKVIKAVDLQVQRLQTKTIWLQNAQKTIENTMSQLKLHEISDWVQRQKDLYQDYFDELWKVKTVITYYYRVREIIDKQKLLVSEYQRAYGLFRQDPHFTPDELDYMEKVYSGILNESLKNLDQVFTVINAFATQMDDAARLNIINQAADNIETNFSDLRAFNNQNVVISLQRAKQQNDVDVVKKLYGLE